MPLINLNGEIVKNTKEKDLVAQAEEQLLEKIDLTIEKLNHLADDYTDYEELMQTINDILSFCQKEFENLEKIIKDGSLTVKFGEIPIEENHQELRDVLLKEMMYMIENNAAPTNEDK